MTNYFKKDLSQKNSFPMQMQILRSKNSYLQQDHLRGLKLVLMMVRHVSEDIVLEILARIPTHQLLKLQGVCRKWKDLISTQYLKDKHTHLILMEHDSSSSMFLFRLNKLFKDKDSMSGNYGVLILANWEQAGSEIFLKRIPESEEHNLRDGTIMIILCSFSGLIVMVHISDEVKNYCDFIIYNPITGEKVIIEASKTRYRFWALFFNPRINEYCVILNKFGRHDDECDEFEILNLDSQPCCKPLKSPNCLPSKYRHYFFCGHPLVVDNAYIYWQLKYMPCEKLILIFNITTEEFSFLPDPHSHYVGRHMNMHIITTNIHGYGCRLSFVQIEFIDFEVVFNIWTLMNMKHSQPNWIRTHNITITVGEFSRFDRNPPMLSKIKVLTIRNGEMLFYNPETRIVFAYNFKVQTLRLIWNYEKVRSFTLNFEFFPYIPTIASLKNCPRKIICKDE